MEKRILRAAIIGCGAISKNHTAVLADADYAEIVAFCDTDPARAEVRRASAPEAEIFTDWKEMLDAVKPDVVHICTPHDLHAEMACECLARGINAMEMMNLLLYLPARKSREAVEMFLRVHLPIHLRV